MKRDPKRAEDPGEPGRHRGSGPGRVGAAPVRRRQDGQVRRRLREPHRLCEEHLPGKYKIEVVDLLVHPQLAKGDQIVAIPTLVRKLPEPIRKVIGDLSNVERTLVGLQLRPAKPNGASAERPTRPEKARP